MSDINLQELRRNKLKTILDNHFFSIASLAKKINISRSNLSNLLSGKRLFSSYTASKIETALGLPLGYLSIMDNDNLNLSEFVNAKFNHNLSSLDTLFSKNLMIPIEIAKRINISSKDNILLTHMNDNLMYPTIKLNDMIIVDLNKILIEENKLYLVDINGFIKVRRLVINQNLVFVHIDNLEKKNSYIVNSYQLDDIKIVGKVIGFISDLN